MVHFEVICPLCAGGLTDSDCHFECTGGVQPRIQKRQRLRLYFAMTCLGCGSRHDCEFAWDWYNTRGDCLAMK